jgi:hypothetical protein
MTAPAPGSTFTLFNVTLITAKGTAVDRHVTQAQANRYVSIYSDVFQSCSADVDHVRILVEPVVFDIETLR